MSTTLPPVPSIRTPAMPPLQDKPHGDDGFPSDAWTAYFTRVSDQMSHLLAAGIGVTDGSDAPAGQVGEYVTANAAGVHLSNNAQATVVPLTLTAGDWDVTGNVVFHISGATSSRYGAGVDAIAMDITATIPTGSGTWRLGSGAPVRRNLTTNGTAQLVAIATFSAGTVTADGFIQARRVR
jgi:hypothetical protein